MIYKKYRVLPALTGFLALTILSPALAETTETTIIKTTTISTAGRAIELPAGGSYVFVDPVSGLAKGAFAPELLATVPAGVVVVDKLTGKVLATVQSGKLVDIATIPAADVLVSSIDARRAALKQMISDALAKGTLSAAEADALRAEVDRIAVQEAGAKHLDGALSYYDALAIAYSLDVLTDKITFLSHAFAVPPVVSEHVVACDNRIVVVDKIGYELSRLEKRVDNEYLAGRLSARQVAQLKEKLNEISALENKYRKAGEYSENKERALAIKIEAAKSQMEKDIAYINGKRSQIGIRVE